MMRREEFIELLRADSAFRDEVRRQVLTDDVLALPQKFDRLSEQVATLVEAVHHLTEAQQRTESVLRQQSEQMAQLAGAQHRTEEALRELADWQRGEVGRRDGERYEREIIRSAPLLFNGGHGGAADQPEVRQRLTEQLQSFLEDPLVAAEENPFLADLFWWKGDRVAVVEISAQVNGYDILRAAKRAAFLQQAGVPVLAVVIGKEWAREDSRFDAKAQQVEWKVGPDLSDGFINFRRAPSH